MKQAEKIFICTPSISITLKIFFQLTILITSFLLTKTQFKYKINAEFLSKKLQKISNKKIIKTGEKNNGIHKNNIKK